MEWLELFPQSKEPTVSDFKNYISSKLFESLLTSIEKDYKLQPLIEYSKCSAAPGWNIKFKKSGKSLCVIYPDKKYFTALVVIGKKEEEQAREIINNSGKYLKDMLENTKFICGGYWLMIDIKDEDILKQAKDLMYLRIAKPKK